MLDGSRPQCPQGGWHHPNRCSPSAGHLRCSVDCPLDWVLFPRAAATSLASTRLTPHPTSVPLLLATSPAVRRDRCLRWLSFRPLCKRALWHSARGSSPSHEPLLFHARPHSPLLSSPLPVLHLSPSFSLFLSCPHGEAGHSKRNPSSSLFLLQVPVASFPAPAQTWDREHTPSAPFNVAFPSVRNVRRGQQGPSFQLLPGGCCPALVLPDLSSAVQTQPFLPPEPPPSSTLAAHFFFVASQPPSQALSSLPPPHPKMAFTSSRLFQFDPQGHQLYLQLALFLTRPSWLITVTPLCTHSPAPPDCQNWVKTSAVISFPCW